MAEVEIGLDKRPYSPKVYVYAKLKAPYDVLRQIAETLKELGFWWDPLSKKWYLLLPKRIVLVTPELISEYAARHDIRFPSPDSSNYLYVLMDVQSGVIAEQLLEKLKELAEMLAEKHGVDVEINMDSVRRVSSSQDIWYWLVCTGKDCNKKPLPWERVEEGEGQLVPA